MRKRQVLLLRSYSSGPLATTEACWLSNVIVRSTLYAAKAESRKG